MKEAAMRHPLSRGRTTLVAAITLILAACAAAPAKLDRPDLRNEAPLAGLEVPTRAGWPAAQWWRQYDDPQLNDLMARAMEKSPDLAVAQSRVQNAEESARLAAAQLGLSVNGSAQVSRQRLSDHGFIPSQFLGFSWYNQADLGVKLQYDFDWWGKKHATMEAALDQARAAKAQRSAAALAIEYAVADTYFSWLADHVRLKLTDQLLATQEQFAHIAQLRVAQGVDLPDEAQKAKAQVAQVREMRAALDGSTQIRRAALASLLGLAPAELPELQPRPLPRVRGGIPADVSFDLISRRPDIAASRWQVEAALKKTDAARAEFFPDLSISAMAGLSSIDLGKLLTYGSRTFALTPALHLPIFNGGSLQANYGVSKAQLDGAIAQYNSIVLTAAREVATQSLTARQIAARGHEQDAQLAADRQLLSSAKARERQGVRDARESLGASSQLLQQQDVAAQLQAQSLSTDLNLIKALGGGYHANPIPVAASTSSSKPVIPGAADHERQ
jgi:multidrug efflux system outer membrane protein